MKNLTLKKANIRDRKDVWRWRNDPEVRKNFFNSDIVPWDEHRTWFDSKLSSNTARIYMATAGASKIGVIRFEMENECAKVSVNLNPAFFGRGMGSKIIKFGTEKFYIDTMSWSPVLAEIKSLNIASQKAFAKAGYKITGKAKNKVIYKKQGLGGARIYLRPLKSSDINERYLSWLNNAEVSRFIETRFSKVTFKDLKNFYNMISKSETNKMFAICLMKDDAHIGNIKLGGINRNHRYADLGIMIGEKRHWGKGYGKEASRLLLEYAFNVLGLNKIILGVYGNHKPAIRTYEKVGFKIEGRIKNLLNFEGQYTDKIIMGVLKKDFQGRKK